ncbi:DUF2512 family protein [Laceyella putida]|uniref:DUF2512 family protein n=1 Tax=Laceyella putida TaxID=110101 RepID=A0ABW2RJX0_9BACL
MRHLTPLLMKFLMLTVLLYLVLGLYFDLRWGDILFLSVTLTLVGYVTDLFILPKVGNYLAILSDLGISYAIIATYLTYLRFENTTIAFYAALAIGIGEWFFHKYIRKRLFNGEEEAMDQSTL